ncbi:MAG: hypothetical protein K2R98_29065 [Gemmataceae bacterium]|nr:hypothetical protein [Gemmataceae bacterium]
MLSLGPLGPHRRFRVDGPAPAMFGPEYLEKLASHTIGKQQIAENALN